MLLSLLLCEKQILVRAFYIQEVRLESLESYLWRCHK